MSLPNPQLSPDPLIAFGGETVATAAMWPSRRQEILDLFQREVFGVTPIGRPEAMRFVVRETKPDARGGLATRLRVGILFEGTESGRQMELLVYLPNAAQGPVPLFLGLNFDGNYTTTDEPDLPVPRHYVNGLFASVPDHRASEGQRGYKGWQWPYDTILARGYGIATACYGEVEPDLPNQWWHGPRVLAPPEGPDAWGAIGGWAWALSRALDFLETEQRVDAKRVAVFGFSRLGKTALWAGAQDERFAAVISQNAGKGGASMFNRGQGEPIAHLCSVFPHWFAPKFRDYADNEAAVPVNAHCLTALIAPRPLLVLSADEDHWSDPEGEFLGALGADAVYRTLGTDGLAARDWPAARTLIQSRLGYFLRPGRHDVTVEDWDATLSWADFHLANT